MKARAFGLIVALGLCILAPAASARAEHVDFQLSSTTFQDGGTVPLSMVYNLCTAYPNGANASPQLSWRGVPPHARTFTVIMYDTVASFTHWGMYNISSKTGELPENAGVAGSTVGTQIANDFGDLNYDGPCPPTQLTPVSHTYVITVYALDEELHTLPTVGAFPPGAEALYHALIAAGRDGHILGTASITGFFPSNH
jgi:Raf kinase inhibitor-like YbhB/YbcL family protein